MHRFSIVDIARLFLFVREAADERGETHNRGLRVQAIQTWSGGAFGDSWCMEMLWLWLDLYFGALNPVPRFQSCQDFLEYAQRAGWVMVGPPAPTEVVVHVHPETREAHHVALCTLVGANGTPVTIAGNTSRDGSSSNGDRVAEHPLTTSAYVVVRIPGVF